MGSRPSGLKLYTLISLMILFWSANFTVGKHVLANIPALLVVGVRTCIAGLAMIVVYKMSAPRPWPARDMKLLLALGLLGVGANQLFFVLGLARTSASHAAIMIGLTPILVLAIAAAMGQESLRGGRLMGMAIALGGVGILQTGSGSNTAGSFLGDVLVLGASASFAWFTVRGKAEAHRLGGVTVNTIGYVASAIVLLPMTLFLSRDFDFSSVAPSVWAGLFYMAIFPSVVCYSIYYYALKYIPASKLAAFSYLQPVIATVIAIPTMGEYPSASLLAGGALVMAGVFVAEHF